MFLQGKLVDCAIGLRHDDILRFARNTLEIPTTKLEDLAELGPYDMQIKNPSQGLFTITNTTDPTRAGYPALWHHKEGQIRTLAAQANARLTRKPTVDESKQDAMLDQSSHLQIARELGHAPQRLAAVYTDERMLGVRSWISAKPKQARLGDEATLALWLNTTPGVLLRITHANRPYLGRSGLPHELLRTLPVLDITKLTDDQLVAGHELYEDLKNAPLEGFAQIASDSTRRTLDRRFVKEVLQAANTQMVDDLAKALAREPTMTTRH